jgi:hypothetical protein
MYNNKRRGGINNKSKLLIVNVRVILTLRLKKYLDPHLVSSRRRGVRVVLVTTAAVFSVSLLYAEYIAWCDLWIKQPPP